MYIAWKRILTMKPIKSIRKLARYVCGRDSRVQDEMFLVSSIVTTDALILQFRAISRSIDNYNVSM